MIHTIDLHFLNIPQAIAAFLVETSAGPVLVETGPHSTFDHLQKGIKAAGFAIEDIQHVLLTHIHFDHAGAAWALAQQGATVYLHPFGAKHLANPEKLVESARRIYQDDMDRLWGEMQPIAESKLHTPAHGEKIKIGNTTFTAWHTPGHAVHHIAWQMEDALFTGDVAGVKISDCIVEPPCPPPDINLEDWQASLSLIRSLPLKALYLTHFGEVKNIAAHLDELEQRLINWANWIRPRWEKGDSVEQTVPDFQQFVAGQLREKGADEQLIKQYDVANPSWMSVAGLMRYWKKKAETKV